MSDDDLDDSTATEGMLALLLSRMESDLRKENDYLREKVSRLSAMVTELSMPKVSKLPPVRWTSGELSMSQALRFDKMVSQGRVRAIEAVSVADAICHRKSNEAHAEAEIEHQILKLARKAIHHEWKHVPERHLFQLKSSLIVGFLEDHKP